MSSELSVYFWIAPDSSSVLGIGQTAASALANAESRHGLGPKGYPARVRIDRYPGGNPLLPVVHGLWAAYPVTLAEAEPPEPKTDQSKAKRAKRVEVAPPVETVQPDTAEPGPEDTVPQARPKIVSAE